MLKNNDVVNLRITDLNDLGEGLAKTAAGEPVIVKQALPGDVVEARIINAGRKQNIAIIHKLLKKSPDRIAAACKIAAKCGSCQLQFMRYERQLSWKRDKVARLLAAAGFNGEKACPVQPVMGMENPWHYRNKTQLPLAIDRKGHYVAGFYADRSHQLVAQHDCLLAAPIVSQIVKIILEFLEQHQVPLYDETTQKWLVRHLLIREGQASGEWLVCLLINGRQLPEAAELVAKLRQIPGMASISLGVNTRNTNAILGDEFITLWGAPYIGESLGAFKFRIGPRTFFQVNPRQTVKLYNTALDFAALTGREEVWDLYCGIGTISLFLAQKAKRVRGVEIVPEAIENARENARLNGVENATFFVGKAEEVVPEIFSREGRGADVVVVDPPRKGCEEILLATIIKMSPRRIVYVSCDPSTLARDLRYLVDRGPYSLAKVQPVDMFPQTSHVETVALLEKKRFDNV